MDFLNKDKLTHIIIFIFILLSLTYLYNMNSKTMSTTINPNLNLNLNTNKSNTITENFMIISEDQDLQANNVIIDNLTQVSFKACGRDANNVNKIVSADPTIDWAIGPLNLQDIFDTKLNNNGVIGTVVPGNTPLQGIILSDAAANTVVKLGANIPFGVPTSATTINDRCIQFGGPNSGKYSISASIFVTGTGATPFPDDSLCIVGKMAETTDWSAANGKISMWAQGGLIVYAEGGGLNVYGPSTLNGSTNITGKSRFNDEVTIIGSIPANHLLPAGNYWYQNNGTGSLIIGCKTVAPSIGSLKLETCEWTHREANGNIWRYGSSPHIPKPTYSSIVCNGRLHLMSTEILHIGAKSVSIGADASQGHTGDLFVGNHCTVTGNLNVTGGEIGIDTTIRKKPGNAKSLHIISDVDLHLMGKGTVVISKRPNDNHWGNASGNLSVEGGLWVAGGISSGRIDVNGGISANIANEAGGCVQILNTSKTGRNINNWTIWNMTGGYGNLLSFWRYAADGTNLGTQLGLYDDGHSVFFNRLEVYGGLYSGGNVGIDGNLNVNGTITGTISGLTNALNGIEASLNDRINKVDNNLSSRIIQVDNNRPWFSDRRLKENIKNISQDEKDKVLQLEPKTFNMISDDKKVKRYGLIAQEVEELYPEFVTEDEKGMKSLRYIELIPLLLEQIKELKKSIPNPNVLNIGGVTLTANELFKLKQIINSY